MNAPLRSRSALFVSFAAGLALPWSLCFSQPPPGYPTYPINFSTTASSTMTPYSMPGLLPQFSTPGGDILGLFVGQGLVVPPMLCNRPAVICPAGPANIGIGFPTLPPCVEIDAYSTGSDWEGRGDPWVVVFSVDRTSVGFSLPRPMPAAQLSDVAIEAVVSDAAADLFVSGFFLRTVFQPGGTLRLSIGTFGWNYLGFDGDGIQRGALPACYPSPAGLGLV